MVIKKPGNTNDCRRFESQENVHLSLNFFSGHLEFFLEIFPYSRKYSIYFTENFFDEIKRLKKICFNFSN